MISHGQTIYADRTSGCLVSVDVVARRKIDQVCVPHNLLAVDEFWDNYEDSILQTFTILLLCDRMQL